ncbi:hypothetical protein VPHK567_0382 [Vibrio phage K567]
MKAIAALALALSLTACSSGISIKDVASRGEDGANGCIVHIDAEATGMIMYQSDTCVVQFNK